MKNENLKKISDVSKQSKKLSLDDIEISDLMDSAYLQYGTKAIPDGSASGVTCSCCSLPVVTY